MAGTSLFRVGDAVELWRVLLHLSVLVACLLLFERALHLLERRAATSAKYQQLLSKAYRELMILGLIGLGLKLAKEAPSVNGGSAAMTAFQVADLTIFILALTLILQTVCIFLRLRRHNVRADRAELLSTEHLADALASSTGSPTRDVQELVHLRLLRHLFLTRFDLPQLFPFAKYLRQAQNNQITHMTDIGAPMWALLLAVAWSLEGITDALQHTEPNVPKRRSLVVVLVGFAWALLALHVIVLVYFRSCVQQLLTAAGMAADPPAMERRLRTIALEEARAWTQEDAGQALLTMQKVQELYEAPRMRKRRRRDGNKDCPPPEDVLRVNIRWFSRKSWHFVVMLLLMLNGFYLALVVQWAPSKT
ncbi:Mlo-related protein [Phytophthora cinnamomi]|uniref:Mlo-related protein n=1 Tax=Phytophthora cinnamomi TaxID=4785 RepID=UPI00355A1C39|nr:Mlo-related protein [Phytophthora cinnamomi]